jgi:hypothetical protein
MARRASDNPGVMGPILEPTPVGCALAAAAVVAGAPCFASGLRALRLRRQIAGLSERPLAEEPTGLVLVRGQVGLESPLVGPLSGRACAGFRLEVRGPGPATVAVIEERRPFRLVAGGVSARIAEPERATWDLSVVAQRAFPADAPLTANLSALLARAPEAARLQRSGAPLTLLERSLLAGSECFVIGSSRHGRLEDRVASQAWARTGTDDLPAEGVAVAGQASAPAPRTALAGFDLWIEAEGHLQFLRVSDRVPAPRALLPSRWRILGLALGPLIGIAGLLYLANAADRFRLSGF